MAQIKITDLAVYSDPVSTDVLPVVDVTANTTKKVSIATLLKNASLGTAALPGIAFDGDPNTGFYSPGADQVAISTAGTGRLFVDASGNVGIGTSSPSSRFNLSSANNDLTSGFLQDGATTGYSAIQIKNTSGNTLIGVNGSTVGTVATNATAYSTVVGTFNNTNLHLITNDIVRATVDTSGNVGIGSASDPGGSGSKLWVDHTADTGITINSTGSTSLTRLLFRNSNSNGEARIYNVTGGPLTIYKNSSEEAVRIDSSGRLLVGTSTATNQSGVVGLLQVEATNGSTAAIKLKNNQDTATPCYIALSKSRGTTVNSDTIVQNGDNIGSIIWFAADGTDTASWCAEIVASIDGPPGVNDVPGRLQFYTTADGASSPTEAMRINNQRELLIGTTTRTANGGVLQISNGITFPGTQSACSDANTLDDYEEGTFTPTITGTTAAGTATYTFQNGRYTKIGRLVQIEIYISWNSGNGTGNLRISGLPFTVSNGVTYPALALGASSNVALTANYTASVYCLNNDSRIGIYQFPTGGGGGTIDVPYDSAGELIIAGCYSV